MVKFVYVVLIAWAKTVYYNSLCGYRVSTLNISKNNIVLFPLFPEEGVYVLHRPKIRTLISLLFLILLITEGLRRMSYLII